MPEADHRAHENTAYVECYLKLHELINMHRRDGQSRSHFATPYNYRERAEVRVVSHQIKIDGMSDEGQVKSVKHPKNPECQCETS